MDGFYLSPFEEDTYVQLTKGDFIFMIKVGDKIRIIHMDGEPFYSGKKVLLNISMISVKFMVAGVDVL